VKRAGAVKQIPVATAKRLGVMQEGELLATLEHHLHGGYYFGSLTGPRRVKDRVAIMQVALGRKVTQAEAGINQLRDVLQLALGIGSDGQFYCIAQVETAIIEAVKQHGSDRRKANSMTVDDILRCWSTPIYNGKRAF